MDNVKYININFGWENLKGRDHQEDVGVMGG
jgi:hypothetical protein